MGTCMSNDAVAPAKDKEDTRKQTAIELASNGQLIRTAGFEEKYKGKELTVPIIRRYLELHALVKRLEDGHPILAHGDKTKRLDYVKSRLKDLDVKLNRAKDNMAIEYKQLEAARQTLKEADESAKELVAGLVTKEEAEYIQAKQTFDLLMSDSERLKKELEKLTAELSPISKQAEELKLAYLEQDAILRGIFQGQYGSRDEHNLERQVDDFADLRARIEAARIRWSSASNVVNTAYIQFATGMNAWAKLLQSRDKSVIYAAAIEANSNLAAAVKNIQLVIAYVSGIRLPFFKDDDISSAGEALNGGLYSKATTESSENVRYLFSQLTEKASQLEQWMKRVVSEIIEPDAVDTDARLREAEERLHAERLRLMRGRAKVLGKFSGDDFEHLNQAVMEAEQAVREAAKLVEKTSAAANDGMSPAEAAEAADGDPVSMRKVMFDSSGLVTADGNNATPRRLSTASRLKAEGDANFEAVRSQLRRQMGSIERKDESSRSQAEKELADRLEQRKWRRVQAQSAAREASAVVVPQS